MQANMESYIWFLIHLKDKQLDLKSWNKTVDMLGCKCHYQDYSNVN